ncbi:MAG: hypothetical protein JNM72_15060 [Deltaproteobacteria bacterium]|nr:hypothetical protein [Deltaproteobacteria bacterium]
MPRPLVRLPDHLGDRVLALPALRALQAAHGPLWLDGRGDWGWLQAELPGCAPLPPGARAPWALLLKPSFSAAWEARRHGARIGAPGELRGPLLSTAVPPVDEHRVQAYLRLAWATGAAPVERAPALRALPAPPLPSDGAAVCAADLLVLLGSATGRTVDWPGLRGVADAVAATGRRVVLVPPRDGLAAALQQAGPHPVARGAEGAPTIPEVAALACAAGAVLGVDSGLSHVSAAARRGADLRVDAVVVVLGSTAAHRTAPPGARALRCPPPPCAPCGAKRCAVRATGTPPCLQLRTDPVIDALQAALDRVAA